MDDAGDDLVVRESLVGVELPEPALSTLATSGVPRLLRLPDWEGPPLFRSEIVEGRLQETTAAGPITREGPQAGYVIGSVRDEDGSPYSFFVLRRGVGDVYLLDAADPAEDRYVNSSLETFLASLRAFHAAFAHMMSDTEERDGFVGSFRKLLNKLDLKALEDETHYWPGWLEAVE